MPGMPVPRLVSTGALVCCILLAFPACSARLPDEPVGESGRPLDRDDPDRYLPPRLAGLRVGKLPPTLNADVAAEADVYGLAEWVTSFQGATMVAGAGDTARGFISVVTRGAPDPDLERRTAFFGSGSGDLQDSDVVQVAGESVSTGLVKNAEGTFPYAVWSPPGTPLTVAVTARGDADQVGFDPTSAMEDLIDWASR